MPVATKANVYYNDTRKYLMNKTVGDITKIFATLFILIVATLGTLNILGAIDTDTLKSFSLKAGAALIILAGTSLVISWLQEDRK